MNSDRIRFSFIGRPRRWRPQKTLVFSCLLTVFTAAALCPPRATASEDGHETYRLLTRDEGVAIIDTISDYHRSLRGKHVKPDCSHLVNHIYDLAGFPYSYAKSADLYRGHANFFRVNAPQPGDLIVWRGHVGLVVEPRQHLFYSSLRSGLETEDYTSPYWHRRGVPRFYRYRATVDNSIITARHAAPRNEMDGTFRTQLVSQSITDEPRTNVTSRDSLESTPNNEDDSSTQPVADAHETYSAAPSKFSINLGNKKPTTEQVKEAISKTYQSVSQGLSADSLLHSRPTFVIFAQLHVTQLEFKGKHGWADVTIDSEATLTSGILDKAAHHEEQRWEIQHAKSGWTLSAPTQNIYVPRSSAVRIFAQQLAQLTDQSSSDSASPSNSQEAHLASLLDALLNQ